MSIDVKERIRRVLNIRNDVDDYFKVRADLFSILADLEREYVPKPTREQLKAIGKVLDGDVPRECKELDLIWSGEAINCFWRRIGSSMDELKGKLRWHLKDVPETPTLMICNHAGECKFVGCHHAVKHLRQDACKGLCQNKDGGIAGAICVPWVEPVVHYSCEGCSHLLPEQSRGFQLPRECNGCWDVACDIHRNYMPKQPEPAAPNHIANTSKKVEAEHFDCDGCKNRTSTQYHSCGYMCADWMHCVRTSSPLRCDWKSQEPKDAPGLVSMPVESFGEYWCVGTTFLDAVFSMVTFHHIELKSGATVTTLSAFSKDDPPCRAWFRVTKNGANS